VQARDRRAVAAAREEIEEQLGGRGGEFVRPLQRAIRDLMSECAGVVRSEEGLREGLARLAEIRGRAESIEVRPDIAGYADLAHGFDLLGSLIAAQATLESALERRETRGAHNRADFPDQDPGLRVNLSWTLDGAVTRQVVTPPSPRVAALANAPSELETAGRLLE
jgi:succinate dehydrogenase / fumarate reductase, flavoprotein subunit